MAKSKSDAATTARHSIAVVSRRTGITQLLLRAWERRYEAVVPERTPTGRRLYTDEDIRRLALLRQLTGQGHRIGDIANFPVAELEELVEEIPVPTPGAGAVASLPAVQADELLGAALAAVAELDAPGLEQVLDRASVALSRPALRQELIAPLLTEIGERWHDGTLRVAHEHLASAIVRSFLGGLSGRQAAPAGAPVLIAATPAGQAHELGALMASTQAVEQGMDVIYLGGNLPAEEIAAVAQSRGARAVLLSLVYPAADAGTAEQLKALRRYLDPACDLVVGGRATGSYADVLREIGAHVVSDSRDLDRQLRRLS